jgi:hypothetical protein
MTWAPSVRCACVPEDPGGSGLWAGGACSRWERPAAARCGGSPCSPRQGAHTCAEPTIICACVCARACLACALRACLHSQGNRRPDGRSHQVQRQPRQGDLQPPGACLVVYACARVSAKSGQVQTSVVVCAPTLVVSCVPPTCRQVLSSVVECATTYFFLNLPPLADNRMTTASGDPLPHTCARTHPRTHAPTRPRAHVPTHPRTHAHTHNHTHGRSRSRISTSMRRSSPRARIARRPSLSVCFCVGGVERGMRMHSLHTCA